MVIGRLLCRAFGHRWEIADEWAYSAHLTLAQCRRCPAWGATVRLRGAKVQGITEEEFGRPDAVEECRRRAA